MRTSKIKMRTPDRSYDRILFLVSRHVFACSKGNNLTFFKEIYIYKDFLSARQVSENPKKNNTREIQKQH